MKRPNKEKPRDRVLSGPEIVAVWDACEASTGPRQGRQVRDLVRTLLLLGQRLGETLAVHWGDLDLDGESPQWDIRPETRKKVGGIGVPHVVPLPPLAVSIFRGLRSVTGQRERVFHGVSYNSRDWWLRPIREKAERLGVTKHWTLHDLRRTVRTGLRELGADRDLAELIIGHGRKGLDAVYDKSTLLPERRHYLGKWAERVESLVTAAEEPTASPTR